MIWISLNKEKWRKEGQLKKKKKETNERLIKDKIIRDIRTLFEQQDKDYCKPRRVGNLWNNNYIKYENNDDKNRKLSLDKYLDKIKSY